VKDEQEYIVVRERVHRNTAESTNTRVKWWSIIQAIVLFAVVAWQVIYLKVCASRRWCVVEFDVLTIVFLYIVLLRSKTCNISAVSTCTCYRGFRVRHIVALDTANFVEYKILPNGNLFTASYIIAST
jgi:hypothetical protein